jgi:hypothetical protein
MATMFTPNKKKLTSRQVKEIRSRYRKHNKDFLNDLVTEFKVSKAVVDDVIQRKGAYRYVSKASKTEKAIRKGRLAYVTASASVRASASAKRVQAERLR